MLRALHASVLIDALDKFLARYRARLGRFVPAVNSPAVPVSRWDEIYAARSAGA